MQSRSLQLCRCGCHWVTAQSLGLLAGANISESGCERTANARLPVMIDSHREFLCDEWRGSKLQTPTPRKALFPTPWYARFCPGKQSPLPVIQSASHTVKAGINESEQSQRFTANACQNFARSISALAGVEVSIIPAHTKGGTGLRTRPAKAKSRLGNSLA